MSNEILQLKPNLYGMGIDLKALFKRLWHGKPPPDPITLVAQRFLQVFLDHGVAPAQIPHLLDEVSLASLRSPEELLKVLTPSALEATAALFGVQRKWLEGVTNTIYPPIHVYQDLPAFLTLLPREDSTPLRAPIRALCSDTPNFQAKQDQIIALVIVEQAATLGEDVIPRFRVLNDPWNWSYEPTRIQLKAMARLTFGKYGPIPLYQVSPKRLQGIIDGDAVPNEINGNSLITNPSLEDYALSATESVVAREVSELSAVLDYLRIHLDVFGVVQWR